MFSARIAIRLPASFMLPPCRDFFDVLRKNAPTSGRRSLPPVRTGRPPFLALANGPSETRVYFARRREGSATLRADRSLATLRDGRLHQTGCTRRVTDCSG